MNVKGAFGEKSQEMRSRLLETGRKVTVVIERQKT